MLVRLGWSNCDYIDGKRVGAGQDAYWVECSGDEVMPLLAERTDDPQVPLEILGWGRMTSYPIDQQIFYFLISRDGSSIVPSSADYPTSSQWHGGSPFGSVGPFDIRDVSELADLPAPPSPHAPTRQSSRPGSRPAMNVITQTLRGRWRR